jgi:hypothetical protein
MVTIVVIVLVTRLRRKALNACSESAYEKKSLFRERINNANKGSANKASKMTLGMMKIQTR